MESFSTYTDGRVDTLKKELLVSFQRYIDAIVQKVSGEKRVKCTAKTARGADCRNLALFGMTLCACHGKSQKTQKTKKVKKSDVPCIHSHDLDDILHEDCHVCQALGNREVTECYIESEVLDKILNIVNG